MELHEIRGQTISRHAHPRPDYARNTQPNNSITKFGGNDILVIFNEYMVLDEEILKI